MDALRAGPMRQPDFPQVTFEMERALPRVSCPALLVYFEDDPFGTPEHAAPLRAAPFASLREVRLPGGAYGATTHPAPLADALLAFDV